MATYTANWQDKETVIVHEGANVVGKIVFADVKVVAYNHADIYADGEVYTAESSNGRDIVIRNGGREIFAVVADAIWGNCEVRVNGKNTGYDIKGKWFKPGTRFTDADDNDLIVVKSDPWIGAQIIVSIADVDISDLMVLTTLYHHIRASSAKTTAAIIGGIS